MATVACFAALSSTLAVSSSVEGPDLNGDLAPEAAVQVPRATQQRVATVYAVADGYFYGQSAPSASPLAGYLVTGALWRALNQLGGVASLGYPISRQWTDANGRLNQDFERGLLRIALGDGVQSAERANVMELLSEAGLDALLEASYSIPASPPAPAHLLSGRLLPGESKSVLDRDPLIRDYFLSIRDWPDRFGLPLAIKRYDHVVTLRTQRGVLRHWLKDSSHAAAGSIEAIDGAALAKKHLVPPESLRPQTSPEHGWLHVDGRQIVDATGRPVRIAGVNWSGFELRQFAPSGLALHDYRDIVDRILAFGFNTIRLPFSNEMVERNPIPAQQAVAACAACRGRPALEIMDLIVDYAGEKGLRIILDNHFSTASDQHDAELWYTDRYSDAAWLEDWQALAERYRDTPAVVGFDLRNEPHGRATWGSGDPRTDWRLAAERAGKAILAINPNVLIIVEGVEQFPKADGSPDFTWWGANLRGARANPVRLPEANVLYSPHEYGPSLYPQRWFNSQTSAESLRAIWTRYWAYLNSERDLPLLIGELGTGNRPDDVDNAKPGSQGQWFQAITAFIRERDNLHWTYWTINSDDPFTLLDSRYDEVASLAKLTTLQPLQSRAFAPLPTVITLERPGLATVARNSPL